MAEEFVLTNENYYSPEANKKYMSNSLFKELYGYRAHPIACEAKGLFAKKEVTEALLVGSYVDSYFEGPDSFKDFVSEHEEQLYKKSGKDKLMFVKDADEAIERISKDPLFMKFMSGEHQTIMTGEIEGQPFKIKMDSYIQNEAIVDLKYVKSAAYAYNPFLRRRAGFIETYGYDNQGAIYREIVRQNTGLTLPFYIAYVTKEHPIDFNVVHIPDRMLDDALDYVKNALHNRPYADIVKNPIACGRRDCPYCQENKKLIAPLEFDEFATWCEGNIDIPEDVTMTA